MSFIVHIINGARRMFVPATIVVEGQDVRCHFFSEAEAEHFADLLRKACS